MTSVPSSGDAGMVADVGRLNSVPSDYLGGGVAEGEGVPLLGWSESCPQPTLSQWSRGLSCRGQMEPVQMCLQSASSPTQPAKSKLIPKGPSPIFDMINSKPVKRKLSRAIPAETASKKQQRLSRLVSSGNCSKERQPEPCTVNSEVKFDMAGLMQRNHLLFSNDLASSSESTTTDRVIGWCDLKEHGRRVCLVVHNSSIACFNTSRDMDDADETTERPVMTDIQALLERTLSSTDGDQFFHDFHKL